MFPRNLEKAVVKLLMKSWPKEPRKDDMANWQVFNLDEYTDASDHEKKRFGLRSAQFRYDHEQQLGFFPGSSAESVGEKQREGRVGMAPMGSTAVRSCKGQARCARRLRRPLTRPARGAGLLIRRADESARPGQDGRQQTDGFATGPTGRAYRA